MRGDVVGRVASENRVHELDLASSPVKVHTAALEISFPSHVVARVELSLERGVRPGRRGDVRVCRRSAGDGIAYLHREFFAQSGHLTGGSGQHGERVQRDIRVGDAVVYRQEVGERDAVDGDQLLRID